jgi:hypothetical protein
MMTILAERLAPGKTKQKDTAVDQRSASSEQAHFSSLDALPMDSQIFRSI